MFLYDVDKGGIEHWGLTNIIEGDPGSEFGSTISLHGKYMAVGAPGMYDVRVRFIFLKRYSERTKLPGIEYPIPIRHIVTTKNMICLTGVRCVINWQN